MAPATARALTLFLLLCCSGAAVAASPRTDYLLYCGGCHLENGSGDPPEIPDLRADIGRIVLRPGGRAFLAQVPGSSQAPISDDRLAGVLNYIVREYARPQAPVEPFTGEEIGGYRSEVLLDPLRRREEILGH